MTVEIKAVGGYNEVGKNMTAVKVGGDVVILDMGIHLDNFIRHAEDEDKVNLKPEELINVGAVPNINVMDTWQQQVKAIIPTHAHLDHVGALPFLAQKYKAPIVATPFTTSVVSTMLRDDKIRIDNPIKTVSSNSVISISQQIKAELVHVTHSTPQTVMAALHTPEGVILYANDFKFDLYPVLGKKPNFNRLQEIGKKGVLALIVDSTYAHAAKKMPSESVAREMLRDVMLGTDSRGKAMIVTTFSSHLARLKSIIEFGRKLDRKIVFLGRSLAKYVYAAEDIGLVNMSGEADIVRYSSQIRRRLKKIPQSQRHKYLFVVTGHQGEPKSTLSKIIDNQFDFTFKPEDHMIFSCTVIPTAMNEQNRDHLERILKDRGVRIFRDIHVSGHAAREDLRDLINLVKPKHIIPAHGNIQMTAALSDLATDMGYDADNIHLMRNGQTTRLEKYK
ncbi:MAG: RNase J family beta-CASP ribonuclease [Candidatus Woesearchaeota archaeon]